MPPPPTPSLEILYQDEWMVAVDKPAGWLVHPASEPQDSDLVAMKILRDQIGKRVHTIHRIDRPTTGVLLMGIDREVSQQLHRALAAHQMSKTYWAVIHGRPPESKWDCTIPIQKEDDKPIREAHTSFQVLETLTSPTLTHSSHTENRLSLIAATPHTGRFHQIRRHLLHAGYPIIGDYRYAGIDTSDTLSKLLGTDSRMLLMAKQLKLTHPVTNLPLTITAKPEPMFLKVADWKSTIPDEA